MNPFRRADSDEADASVVESAPVEGLGRPPRPLDLAPDTVGHLDEMDADIAARWDLWSVQIGHAIYPALEELQSSLPDVTAIMVCTADGLNVCALGLDDAQVGRLSALATSLFSVGTAATQVTRADWTDAIPQTVSLHDGENHTVLVSMRGLVIGSLLMWVTAHDASLGSLLVRSKHAAARITEILQDDDAIA